MRRAPRRVHSASEGLVFGLAAEKRVFDLHRRNGMHGMCPEQRGGRRLRQAEVPDLSLPDGSDMAPTVSSIGTFESTQCR